DSSAAVPLCLDANVQTIDGGVALGTTSPAPEQTTKSGTPASAIVGTFGNVGHRSAEVTASARIVPDSICEMCEARLSTAKLTSPANIAGMVCAAPRNGT